jgi:hypothetical protein
MANHAMHSDWNSAALHSRRSPPTLVIKETNSPLEIYDSMIYCHTGGD